MIANGVVNLPNSNNDRKKCVKCYEAYSSKVTACHNQVSGKSFRTFGTVGGDAAGGVDGCRWIFNDWFG